ncbi:hypothetical protein AXF42_Ash005756 [Apostasia shenzhenica]|uniref:Uncharacterized protein n=1 Tax=Apostasia shenzhenica TaxID=1088818 RepID=A0A2I0BCA8_9ASPA|nr:hypothetical protein AXF42_Ash005756 [Apostasia shenzhenica]
MDGSVEQRSTESIKITMLQHEQVFKQQVHELHRLYEVQKKLMAELRSRDMKVSSLLAKDKLQSSTSTSETSHSCHFSAGNQSNSAVKSGQNLLNRFSPATTVSNYFSESFFSEGEGRESCSEEDCNLDLTLSIGCNSDKKKRETWEKIANESSHLLEWSAGFDAESLKRPQWLFQALNLNRT